MMKIVAKTIKTIVVFEYDDKEKYPRPYKFKMREDSEEETTVIVDRIIHVARSKIGGVDSIIYQCQSVIRGVDRRYELKYIIPKCSWQLYKY